MPGPPEHARARQSFIGALRRMAQQSERIGLPTTGDTFQIIASLMERNLDSHLYPIILQFRLFLSQVERDTIEQQSNRGSTSGVPAGRGSESRPDVLGPGVKRKF